MAYDVFISYSRLDSALADEICAKMKQNGLSYFIDRRDIAGGMEFPEEIATAIKESSFLLFLASHNSYLSRFTRNEVLFALKSKGPSGVVSYILDGSNLPVMFRTQLHDSEILRIETCPIFPELIDELRKRIGKQAISHVLSFIDYKKLVSNEFEAHDDWALDCGFSPDGKLVYTCGYEGDIKIFDRYSGKKLYTLSLPNRPTARKALFTPDGSILYSIHTTPKAGGFIVAWSVLDGSLMSFKPLDSEFCCNLLLSKDCSTLVASDSSVGLIDVKSLELIKEIPLPNSYDPLIYGMGFVEDDKAVIIGGDEMPVLKMNLETGEMEELRPAHSIEAIAVKDAAKNYAVAWRNSVAVYKYEKEVSSMRIFYSKGAFFESLAYNREGSLIVAGDKESNIYVWDLRSGRVVLETNFPGAGRLLSVCFSPDDRSICVSSESGKTYILK